MRKFEQKQLLELIDTVKRTTGMLDSIYSAGEINAFHELLARQQEAAISIGTRLEDIMIRDASKLSETDVALIKETVQLLELYCELLWNISNTAGQVQLQESIDTLNEAIIQTEKNIQEIPVRLEVAFLPYKASMWDCMETVWMAAEEDQDCDVYVVPIPYFDLKPDGTADTMHYEAALMPKNVPVTDFRKYKIEERRPDVIYIHNPYDGCNKVTSVHPDYYSANLKKYTDMLVYIPYFLLGEHLAKSHSLLPAYVYADKIVLNAETQIDDIDHSIPRDKFIVAGSTKAERLQRMEQHKDELEVPADWKRKMEGRKVVFYNLSISGLLKHREKMLSKMDEVFGVFEKRDDVVMMYRPHPLIESTLTSMCPELLADYQALVKRVKKMKNAIYDTTPDASVAVALSDAYVGENSSSVAAMFQVLQKPIFYLNEKMYYQPTLDEMMSERTMDVCRVGDDLWFVTHPLQMLCKYNLNTNEMECVAEVPETPLDGRMKYVSIVYCGNRLILVPYRADALCIYDMEKQTFRKDYFREEYVNSCFGRAIVRGNYVFLTPINYPTIVRYDVLTGEYNYFDECIKEAYSMIPNACEGSPFVWGVASYEEELYLASSMVNIVITFNMETYAYTISRVGEERNKYRGVAADATYCWMILQDAPKVVRWNRNTGDIIEFLNCEKEFIPGDIPFKNIVDMGKEVYMVPYHANHTCKLDKADGKIIFTDFRLPYTENAFKSEYYSKPGFYYDFAKKISEKEIVACSLYDNSLMVFNVETCNCEKSPIRIESCLERELKKNSRNLYEMSENASIPLNKFLECLVQNLLSINLRIGISKKKLDAIVNVGFNIHTEIKKDIIKR